MAVLLGVLSVWSVILRLQLASFGFQLMLTSYVNSQKKESTTNNVNQERQGDEERPSMPESGEVLDQISYIDEISNYGDSQSQNNSKIEKSPGIVLPKYLKAIGVGSFYTEVTAKEAFLSEMAKQKKKLVKKYGNLRAPNVRNNNVEVARVHLVSGSRRSEKNYKKVAITNIICSSPTNKGKEDEYMSGEETAPNKKSNFKEINFSGAVSKTKQDKNSKLGGQKNLNLKNKENKISPAIRMKNKPVKLFIRSIESINSPDKKVVSPKKSQLLKEIQDLKEGQEKRVKTIIQEFRGLNMKSVDPFAKERTSQPSQNYNMDSFISE